MKHYQPCHDEHLRSPWRRASNRRPTTADEIEGQLAEAEADAREYAELSAELAELASRHPRPDVRRRTDDDARRYRTRANAAAHRAATLAAYLRESAR